MWHRLAWLAFLAWCLALFAGCGGGGGTGAAALEPAGSGSLRVTALDAGSGGALAGATVRWKGGAALTGADGTWLFENAPSGPTAVTVTKPGYQTRSLSVTVPVNATSTCQLSLTPRSSAAAYDVVVVGAGSSGVAAAIQAASLGAKVALVEETDWIGGQMTASGVSTMDSYYKVSNRSGIYLKFLNRIKAHYAALGKSVGTCYYSNASVAFEPSVGQQVLYSLLEEASSSHAEVPQVDLYLRAAVGRTLGSAGTVTGVELADGTPILGKVTIDATEFGDLLPLAGARYRVGNSTSDNVQSTACISNISYTPVLKKYQVPDSRLTIQDPPPGYAAIADPFQLFTTPQNWESFYSNPTPNAFNFAIFRAWRGMPDSSNPLFYDASPQLYAGITRTGLNALFNDLPVTVAYLEDRAVRNQMDGQAKLKALRFIYFMQHDLGENRWSVANDLGYDTPYNLSVAGNAAVPPELKALERFFPLRPYVRESRRVIGAGTINAADIKRSGVPLRALKNFPSALAVGDYPTDLHGCGRTVDLDCGDTSADLVTDPAVAGGLYQIPFEVFVPETVDGFLVAEKNLSVSRMVQASIRTQPTTMLIGQAAGALAALAAQKGVPPRQVKPVEIQWELLKAGVLLTLESFSDVPFGHPWWKQVSLAALHRLFPVSGTFFGVDGGMTQADAAEVVNKAFGAGVVAPDGAAVATRAAFAKLLADSLPAAAAAPPSSPRYADVPPTHPQFAEIQKLEALGVLADFVGTSPQFFPLSPIRRGEVALLVVNSIIKTGRSTF